LTDKPDSDTEENSENPNKINGDSRLLATIFHRLAQFSLTVSLTRVQPIKFADFQSGARTNGLDALV